MRTKAWVLVVAALLSAGGAQAVTVLGARSCGAWVAYHEGKGGVEMIAAEATLVGYLSGLASATDKDVLKGVDGQSLFLWTTNYCKANPLDSTYVAAQKLFLELSKKLEE